jgi:TrkA domain protein
MDVRETRLPGVGLRYEFGTRDGERIAVIASRGGDFEFFVYALGLAA